MTCSAVKLPGGATGIVCTRGPRPKACHICHGLSQLVCDGCDRAVCSKCSVAPSTNLDFCTRCIEPVFRPWMREGGKFFYVGTTEDEQRANGRGAFRVWAAENPTQFEPLRSAQSRKHG